MSAEIAFERFALALETTRGTRVTPPTHIITADGALIPRAPQENSKVKDGSLAGRNRSIAPRKWADWNAEGELDTVLAPVIANMAVKVVSSPTTPSGATNSRLWAFVREMSVNNLKTSTMFFGDPNVMIWRAAMGFTKSWTITADGTGTSPVTWSADGMARFPTSSGSVTAVSEENPGVVTSPKHGLTDGDTVSFASVGGMTELNGNSYTVANSTTNTFELSSTDTTGFTTFSGGGYWTLDAPTWPTTAIGELISPMDFQIWLDSTEAIGTTAITGRGVSATLNVTTGLQEKFLPEGPGSQRTLSKVGVGDAIPVATIVFELADPVQYNLFREETDVKLRVRLNGALIETVSGTDFYEYFEFDIYGKLEDFEPGDLEGTNRTIAFTINGKKDATLGSDLRVAIQNARTSL